jgi:hypothetical protein
MKFLSLLLLILLVGCNSSGGDKFAALEDSAIESGETPDGPVEIESFFPTDDPVIIANAIQNFNIVVKEGAGLQVSYKFVLDGVEVKDSTAPFYNLDGSTLSTGDHALVVTASNPAGFTDSHTFNLYKNTTPDISLVSNTSSTVLCNGSNEFTINLSATDINVPDRAGLQFNAYLNGVDNSDFLSESYSVTSGSATAEVSFDPDCTLVGTNAVTVRVTDVWGDYEEYSMNVTVTTNGDVEIDDYTPSTATTVLTDATISFAVTVMPGAGDVNYKFELDGNEVKNSSAAFYALDGSTLALEAGAHTLVVTATNATSSATRTWNLHRNTAPEITIANETDTDIPCSGAGNTYTLNASAMDDDVTDMPSLSFSSALNGSSSVSLADSTGPTFGVPRLAGTVFTANCSLLGSNTIRIRVTDQWGDYDDLTRTVTLDGPITFATYNPAMATIDDPYLLPSSGDITFSATIASGAGNRVSYAFVLDSVEKQNNSANFYTLGAADISALPDGLHSMVLTASNPGGFSTTRTYYVFKNIAPEISYVSNTSTSVDCGDTFTLNLTGSDDNGTDRQGLVFSSQLNGASNAKLANTFNNTWNSTGLSGSYTAQVVFTPVCPGDVGSHVVNVRLTDQWGATDNYPFAVTVVDPVDLAISNPTPSGTIVLRENASSNSQSFSVTATGTSPITYSWSLPTGPSVGSCTTASCLVTNNGSYYGAKVLSVTVDDATTATPVSQSFNVNFNDKPEVTAGSPNLGSTTQLSCSASTTITATITDAYLQTSANTFTATWKVNGLSVPTSVLNPTAVNGSGPYTASATFAPNCDEDYIGVNEITLEVSDGYETSDPASWNVNVSYFSSDCLNATSGQICTLAGIPGLSENYDTRSTGSDFSNLRIRPNNIEEYSVGSDTGLFITDTYYHVVWFFNNNPATGAGSNDITVNGVTVAPKKIRIIAGVGAAGYGLEGMTNARSFYLNAPKAAAFDSATGNLYIADYNNSRIVKVDINGVATNYTFSSFSGGTYIIGTSNTNGHSANSGVQATSHRCSLPTDIELSNNKLYVVCFGNTGIPEPYIKSFDLSNNQGTNVLLYNGSNTDGVIGSAIGYRAFSLAKHPTQEIIFFNTVSWVGIGVINNSGSPQTFTVSSAGATKTVNSGSVGFLLAPGAVGATTPSAAIDINSVSVRIQDYGDLEVKINADGSTIDGLFMSSYNSHQVSFLNLSNSNKTFGNRTVTRGQIDRVLGTGVQGGYAGNPVTPYSAPGYTNTMLNFAHGLAILGDKLFFADVFNYRVGSMAIDSSNGNGAVTSEIGNKAPYGYDGEVDGVATTLRLAGPAALTYDSSRNRLYFSELIGNRIRYIDLDTGRIRTSLGITTTPLANLTNNVTSTYGGNTSATSVQNSSANIRVVRDLAIAETANTILFTDARTDNGGGFVAQTLLAQLSQYLLFGTTVANTGSQVCLLRAANDGVGDQNIFGTTTISPGYSATVAGNFTAGCNGWISMADGTWTSNEALTATSTALGIEPTGILVNDAGTEAYVSNRSNHCITRVSSTITAEVGKCNCTTATCNGSNAANAGNTNSTRLNSRFTFPGDLEWDSLNSGNYFVVDRSGTTASILKYVNYSGSPINVDGELPNDASPNSVGALSHTSIPAILNYVWGIAANDFMICFTQGAYAPSSTIVTAYAHTVTCIDRTGGTNHKTIGRQSFQNNSGVSPPMVIRNKIQLGTSEERTSAGVSTSVHHPMGIAFDSAGNLYFTDYASNTIKKVKRWY